ncbi:MAG: DNA repair protein RecN [Elusimicrobia bacterium]|nr:DNA repair protein RecN [Elusimicrobiota bacterium]
MFSSIKVKDFALVEEVSIDLGRGLNIISGQTGAGKSILIGALSMVLGERVGREIVRKGKEFCEVAASFRQDILTGELSDFLKERDIDSSQLLLRRRFYARGRSSCYINDIHVTLKTLKSLGDMLVDIHSQNQHQALLNKKVQRELLDRYISAENLVGKVKKIWDKYKILEKEKKNKEDEHRQIKEEIDRLRYELKEIDAAELYPEIDEDTDRDYAVLNNAERLFSASSRAYNLFYERERSILEQISEISEEIEELKEIDGELSPVYEILQNMEYEIEAVSDGLRSYKENISYSSSKFEEVSEKKDLLNSLKRKYGGDIKSVIEYRDKIKNKLSDFDTCDEKLEDINNKLKKVKDELQKKSNELTGKRKKGSNKLSDKTGYNLGKLGMSDAEFKIELIPTEPGPTGSEEVVFKIKTNPGESLMELKKIASGGETSRVMLAVKSALAAADSIPILIFDEIDTGIGATIGSRVAVEIKKLSGYHQIIVVTHMPQIAAKADRHFKITKGKKGKRTVTDIKKISSGERVGEIARLLGGKDDEISRKKARELINNQEKKAV